MDKSGSEALCSFFNKDYAVSKTNAILENNGTISGTGSIAGIIETTKENAKLKINNYSISSAKVAYKTSKSAGTINASKLLSYFKKSPSSFISVFLLIIPFGFDSSLINKIVVPVERKFAIFKLPKFLCVSSLICSNIYP